MPDISKFLKEIFPEIPLKQLAQIISKSYILRLKRGELFIEKDIVDTRGALIVSGLMRFFVKRDDDDEKNILFRMEREMIGAPPSMFRDEVASESIEALEDSTLLVMDFKQLRVMSNDNIYISRVMNKILVSMLLDAITRIDDFTTLNPEQRYLKFISEEYKLSQRIPLKHIASYLGITVYSLSRIRGRLSKGKP